MKYLHFIFILFLSEQGVSQIYKLPDLNNPNFININSIVRKDSVYLEVSKKKVNAFFHFAVTILNSDADNRAEFNEFYSEDCAITNIRIKIYDKNGNLLESVRPKEIENKIYKTLDGVDKRKYFKPKHLIYPYTLEYEYNSEYTNQNYILDWDFNGTPKEYVETSIVVLKTLKDFRFNYKQENFDSKPTISNYKDTLVYKWRLADLKGFVPESFCSDSDSRIYSVSIRPVDFFYEGLKGSRESWSSLGKWYFEINKGRDNLSVATIKSIKAKTKDDSSILEKIRSVRAYVDSNTYCSAVHNRFSALEAEKVEVYKTGDCKDLSNYTMALLKAIGIPSYCALINIGPKSNDISPDFVVNDFDHQILCIPINKDTLWMECTTSLYPLGYIGKFTGQRHALVITPNGGILSKVPSIPKKENQIVRTIIVKTDSLPGKTYIKMKNLYSGLCADSRLDFIDMKQEDQINWINDNPFVKSNHSIIDHSFENRSGNFPLIAEKVSLTIDTIFSLKNNSLELSNLIFDDFYQVPEDTIDSRTQVIEIKEDYTVNQTLTFSFKKEVRIKVIETISFDSDFGKYMLKPSISKSTLKWYRSVSINKGIYPKEKFRDFIKFIRDVNRSDKTMAIISL